MNKHQKTILICLSTFLLGVLPAWSATIVNITYGADSTEVFSTYTVPAGHTATLSSYTLGAGGYIRFKDANLDEIARIDTPLDGTFTLTAGTSVSASSTAFAQLTVTELSTDSAYIPQNTVVIPSDAAGPVQIILESSTDLLTWTPTSPGTYGTSTAQRFFRVRAVVTSP